MKLRRHGLSTSGSLSRRVARIIVESAALYSMNHLLYAVLYEVKNQVESTPSFLVSLVQNRLVSFVTRHVSTGSKFGEHHL
jgi:hypothetical protein